jgi:hypothetical protein
LSSQLSVLLQGICHPQHGHDPFFLVNNFTPTTINKIDQKNPQKPPEIIPKVFSKIAKPIAIKIIAINIFFILIIF